MYNDYDVVHESTFGILPEVVIGSFIILGIITLISLISMAIVYKKAEKPWWSALVPIYNLIIELELATMPMWTIILLFIPIVNIVVMIKAKMNIAIAFNKKKEFGIGLTFLPFIFYPILAFGKNEYRGINNSAFETYTVDPNAAIKEITMEDIGQTQFAPQVPITMGTGEKSDISVPEELKAPPLSVENKTLPPQEVLADFRVQKEEKPSFVLPENVLLQEEANIKPEEKNENKVASIQDFYSKIKEENQKNEPINPAQQIANQMTQIIEPINTVSNENSEFVTCPKCNAKIKKGAPQCFLCGTKLEQ